MTLEGTIRHGMSLSTECVSDVMVIAFGPIGTYINKSDYYTKAEIDATKQDKLVSGTNIKTINNESLLGSGNIDIQGGGGEQVQSDWTEADSDNPAYIKHKPTLAAVATSGSYNDLTNKPSIPAAQVQSDWSQSNSSSVDFIKNKPTNVSAFTNDAGYLTSADLEGVTNDEVDAIILSATQTHFEYAFDLIFTS